MHTQGQGSRPSSGISDAHPSDRNLEIRSSQFGDEDLAGPVYVNHLPALPLEQPIVKNGLGRYSLRLTPESGSSESSPVSSENEEAVQQPSRRQVMRDTNGNDHTSPQHPLSGTKKKPIYSEPSNPTGRGALSTSTKPLGTGQTTARTDKPGNHVESIPDINICVLGAANVGKTTFVKRTFNLRAHPIPLANTRKVSLDGRIYKVRLLEINSEHVDIEDDGRISWPKTIDNCDLSNVDGVLVLYSVMDSASLAPIARSLSALQKNGIPSVLVSCKCDNHPALREVDPALVEQKAKCLIGAMDVLHTLGTAPDTYKICMSVLLRSIVARSKEEPSRHRTSRPRPTSSGSQNISSMPLEYLHDRATSDTSIDMMRTSAYYSHEPDLESEGSGARTPTPAAHSMASDATRSPVPLRRTVDGHRLERKSHGRLSVPGKTQREAIVINRAARDSTMGVKGKPSRTFLNLDESASAESTDDSESDEHDDELTPGVEENAQTGPAADVDGVSLDTLVDRLVSQPASKADEKFIDIFLALYRKFSSPYNLLNQIIVRFSAPDDDSDPQVTGTMLQQSCLIVLERWSSLYPGDFAHYRTKRLAQEFIAAIASTKMFAVSAKELSANLNFPSEDNDGDWAYCDDDDRPETVTADSNLDRSPVGTSSSTLLSTSDQDRPSAEGIDGSTLNDDDDDEIRLPQHARPEPKSPSASASLRVSKGRSALNGVNSIQSAQRTAQTLVPNSRYACTKVQWHQLMDIPEELIARELTRIDWLMFISIRPRDLIRHISLASSGQQNVEIKRRSKAVENVTRMIDHFNHLAYWVANLVLLREKPKHRALGLEKLMRVARKLRELNNYNALGALVAGINSTPVHRLAATRDLISSEIAKDFMKLEILMSTQKSHFAYRLAWENSSTERIPFLPLHRRDLVSAEQGSKTFVGEGEGPKLINWKKFEIMGDAVVGIMKAQDVPGRYKDFLASEEIRSLVLDGKLIKDDDELYERSVQVEPAGAGPADRNLFRKWFQ